MLCNNNPRGCDCLYGFSTRYADVAWWTAQNRGRPLLQFSELHVLYSCLIFHMSLDRKIVWLTVWVSYHVNWNSGLVRTVTKLFLKHVTFYVLRIFAIYLYWTTQDRSLSRDYCNSCSGIMQHNFSICSRRVGLYQQSYTGSGHFNQAWIVAAPELGHHANQFDCGIWGTLALVQAQMPSQWAFKLKCMHNIQWNHRYQTLSIHDLRGLACLGSYLHDNLVYDLPPLPDASCKDRWFRMPAYHMHPCKHTIAHWCFHSLTQFSWPLTAIQRSLDRWSPAVYKERCLLRLGWVVTLNEVTEVHLKFRLNTYIGQWASLKYYVWWFADQRDCPV